MVIGSGALTIVCAVVLSHAMLRYFAGWGGVLAGLLISMSVRMFVPLVFVLVIVLWEPGRVPAWSAMYIAPLYFVMLIAETVFALRRCNVGKNAMLGQTRHLSQIASNEG